MVLAIDVGNTNIVIGCFDENSLAFVSRIQTDKNKMADEYAITFNSILNFHGVNSRQFDGAIISSVVPSITPTLKKALNDLLYCKVMTVSPGTKTGLNIKIENPAILGADLVCGAVRAMRHYPLPCIVVDLGTATKFTVLAKDGELLGVSIMPGVMISLEALCKGAAMLPNIDFSATAPIIGKNTPDSMRSGIIYGTASMIDGMIEKINKEIGEDATVIATGGVAPQIISYCNSKITVDSDLVLWGLKDIYDKNNA